MTPDLVVRRGLIVDGSGAEPFSGDIAISAGTIVAVGDVPDRGKEEIDATGMLVTPGFVDIHTHYDGQAIWSDRLNPSSAHGVTTVLTGNCGVGFAPCRPDDRGRLLDVMAGVEDIPEIVMAEGLGWDWETFPDYLDALDARRRDIDVATLLPHSPLRVYVMGERGARREPATADDLARMRSLSAEAIRAGALGVGSSRLVVHKTLSGEQIPSYAAADGEFRALVQGIADAGGGLVQMVPDVPMEGYESILRPFVAVACELGQPITFTLATGNGPFPDWPEAMRIVEAANADGGTVRAQVFPRPIGLVAGLDLSIHPFVTSSTYQRTADLPLRDRVAALRREDIRRAILSEPAEPGHPLAQFSRMWDWMFPIGTDPDYEPPARTSIAARAADRGVSPEEEAYDRLLDEDGQAMLLISLGNFQDYSLDRIGDLMRRDDVVLGLGDGGAHYGMICDASYPTFLLAHWTRDRRDGRLCVAEAVRALTSKPAEFIGLRDRGRLAPGYKADLNIIDHAALRLHRPVIRRDLPGGGRRLDQAADGYVATIVGGEIIARDGRPTGALPGRLVRGRRMEPIHRGTGSRPSSP